MTQTPEPTGAATTPDASGETPIRWGIAGTGGIAAAFARDLALLPDAELVAVGSRAKESAEAFGERFEIPNRHVGYEALAADPEVDAIYVAVPHPAHHDVTLTAVAAGKAVLCEKPFSLNAAQAERMVAAARAAGVPLMEAMWVRFLPHFAALRQLLGEGRIGRVQSIVTDRSDTLSTDPAHRVLAAELGGGALLDLGVYPVSLVSMILGEGVPTEVAALVARASTGVDARTSVVLGYPSGAHALITTALDSRTANALVVTGETGRIEVPHVWARTSPVRVVLLDDSTEVLEFTHAGHGLRHQAGELGRLLRAGETESPVIPLDETLTVMRTLDLIRERIGLRYPGE